MEKIKKIIKALINKETITYLIFGVLTTVVSFVTFKAFDVVFNGKYYLLSNTISWIASVIFAYVTNKLFVFESKSWKVSVLKKEIPSFLGARIASYFVEQFGMFIFVTALNFGDKVFDFKIISLSGKMTAKVIVSVLVVIINYVLSKFLIFTKKDGKETQES
ncbi:MAG: GtrA family protein [Faecalibacterium sp.]|nr:GtrA family protein [Ruminococcus sp.]MCM1391385.1 GtrA family protein [Ruminococcus sp.]MCM1484595.1 GtrA family protein [Faecalibacterium sp.]